MDIFLIATDEEGVFLDYGTPQQRLLTRLTPRQAGELLDAGHFPAGSMGPKVDAVMQFTEATGNRGVICHLEDIEKTIAGEAGTEIVK